MAQDFTTILVAPPGNLVKMLLNAELRLEEFGFKLDPLICRVTFDSERGVFDETDDEPFNMKQSLSATRSVADWTGVAAEFWSETLTAYVLLAHSPAADNSFIDLDMRAVRRLADKARDLLYPLLETLALCCGATAGFADLNLPFAPISHADVLKAIGNNPENPGSPSALGLISSSIMSNTEVAALTADIFMMEHRKSGYYILQQKGFFEAFASR